MRKIRLPCLHNFHMLKKIRVVLFRAVVRAHVLKEILQHTHIQRLAKAARAGK